MVQVIIVSTLVQACHKLVVYSDSENTLLVITVTALVQDYLTLATCLNSEHTLEWFL